MNNRTTFALLAFLTAVGTLSASTAFAESELPNGCVGCTMNEAKQAAAELLQHDLPVSVMTDKTGYGHDEMIMVYGQVANVASGFPVTITVVSPLNSIVTIDQLEVADDGSFETSLSTAGSLWKYDGTYIIKANYGNDRNAQAKVELTGGVAYETIERVEVSNTQCGTNQINADGNCIPFSISGGEVTSATINTKDNSIVVNIDSQDDGTITLSPSNSIIKGVFMVLVDGEQSDDVEIDSNSIKVMFPAGTEQIEVIGTYVIPEFGAIAAMILAVAIISIIAVSARSKLSIMPRY